MVKISVKAKPNAKNDLVEKIDDQSFIVSVKEPPIQGRANRAIIKLLSDYFKVPLYNVTIISGRTARNKVIDIN